MTRARGFTLVELVVAIVLSAMIVGFIATLMTSPVDAYVDQGERAKVSASAEILTARLRSDLRNAVPASARVRNSGGRSVLEVLELVERGVSYYIPKDTYAGMGPIPPNAAEQELDLGIPGDTFVLASTAAEQPRYLVIGAQDNAYDLTSTALLVESPFAQPSPGVYQVALPSSFAFVNGDAQRRAYWVSSPVAYICNPTTGTIRRYTGYNFASSTPTSESAPQLNGAEEMLLSDNALGCRFTCDDSNSADACKEVVMLRASLTRPDASSEKLALFEQISVVDPP